MMSIVRKQGVLIYVSDSAIHDRFADKDILDVILQDGNERIPARLPVGKRDMIYNELPAIGDMLQIGWDYDWCELAIIQKAKDRTPIETTYPIAGERSANLIDILNSIDPQSADKNSQ